MSLLSENFSCEDIQDVLYLFVVGELEAEDVAHVVTHLAHCDECRNALVQHARLNDSLGQHMKSNPLPFRGMSA